MAGSLGNAVQYENQTYKIEKRVFFTGSGALQRGLGLCYNRDYNHGSGGAASDNEGRRDVWAELPTRANNMNFAGVTDQGYDAVTGGRWIVIYEPGSVCDVAIGADTVVNTGRLTCSCTVGDQGRFSFTGVKGRGSFVPYQTNASGRLADQVDGGTDAFDATGLILTTADTGELEVGDWIFVIAGEDDATNKVTPTAGPLEITALVEDTTITIGTSQADGGTMEASWYGMSNNQTALGLLEDGEESGLVQWITPENGALSAPNIPSINGVTILHGGFTPSADATYTLADGTQYGQRKTFLLTAALGSNDFLATVTNGITFDGSTALQTFEMDAASEVITLEWNGAAWRLLAAQSTIALT